MPRERSRPYELRADVLANLRAQVAAKHTYNGLVFVSFHFWYAPELEAITRVIRAAGFRNGLVLGHIEGGNGHMTAYLHPASRPPSRVYSGTRGRGAAKAKEHRSWERAFHVLWAGHATVRAAGRDPFLDPSWACAYQRGRRGPKGHRILKRRGA